MGIPQPPGKPQKHVMVAPTVAITIILLFYGAMGLCFFMPFRGVPKDPPPAKWFLHDAVERGDEVEVERLLNGFGGANELDTKGNSPLWYALSEGQFSIADLLFEKGADLSEVNREGKTLLQRMQELRSQKYISAEQAANCERALLWLQQHNAPLNPDPKKQDSGQME